MADARLMTLWTREPETENCWELTVPDQAIYNLVDADGDEVTWNDANGQRVQTPGVSWYLDLALMDDDGAISQHRFVTIEAMNTEEAQEWALDIAESAK